MKAIFDARTLSHQDRAEMRRIFDSWIKQAERGTLRLRIPKDVKPVQNLGGMHYHYRPEIFLQIYGRTEFRFPREKFEVLQHSVQALNTSLESPRTEALFNVMNYARESVEVG